MLVLIIYLVSTINMLVITCMYLIHLFLTVLIILNKFVDKLGTTCYQFGFKKRLSCDIFLSKQTLDYYKSRASQMYICYIGVYKAFDRINHWALSKKLSDRNIPAIAIRLLCTWHTTQKLPSWHGLVSMVSNITWTENNKIFS